MALVISVLFMVAMGVNAQLSPSVPNTCLDDATGNYICCNGYDQIGNECVVWKCSSQLLCSRGRCNLKTGRCICPQGWVGTKCELPCKIGKYGQNCMYECNCINGAECEPVNGNCVCLPGYIGNTCETPCQQGMFGRYCREKCNCLNGSPCSSVDGICQCEHGLTGDRCETCLPEQHRMQCYTFCNAVCMNGGKCDTIIKQCQCSLGYTGRHCETCNPEIHPSRCVEDCQNTLCANGAQCSTETRNCQCTPGWTGRSCNSPCENNYYGQNCEEVCNCGGLQCHHVTGQCLSQCPPGWKGENCRQPCIEGSYGYNCLQTCTCKNGAQCDPVTGSCSCTEGFRGKNCDEKCPPDRGGINCRDCLCESPLTCNDEFERCVCPAGRTGQYCKKKCLEGYYGPSCLKKCSCHRNESCDAVTGVCNCEPGWIGVSCESMCTEGTFGAGCSLTCPKCPDHKACFHINGSCDMCNPGFTGKSCNITCSQGFYGANCLYRCTCNNGLCNPTNGACPAPYSQSPSTVVMNYVHDEKDNDFPLFIVISASTLCFLLILMLTVLIGTRIYQKGYKHGAQSNHNGLTDEISMSSTDGKERPYTARATVQTFTASNDSRHCEFSTQLHIEGDTPDIIASNSTSCTVEPDESSYTEVEINLCRSKSNEYLYTNPPALPTQNPHETPACYEDKKFDFKVEAYLSIENQDSNDNKEDNCYDFLTDAETLTIEPNEQKPQPQYYVLEPTDDVGGDDDYDSISDDETGACLPVPNNYEEVTINRPRPQIETSETYEEVTDPLMNHHRSLDNVDKNKKNVYDLLGHSAKRRKRYGSDGSKLNGNNSNYSHLHKEPKAQTGYNELEFGLKAVRVGTTVFPTGNYYGSLNR